MSHPLHILAFSGSLRRASFNTALLREAAALLPDGVTLEIFDLAPIPLYNGDVEAVGVPEPVREFKARIAQADALLVACPEYNYSVTGVLKNAIDWASRPVKDSPLQGKPLAMLGAGGQSGTMRAQFHLRQILVHSNVLVLNKPEVYIARAREKFDTEGRLMDDATREHIGALVAALVAWTRRLSLEHEKELA
ncbi:MAG: NAD(P)H-dependent oxidoreductase [Anaerolineae bacterium]|nr:NAD(P)H-dependent oxidoreductase [Anaerolineae bacterium]